MQKKIIVPTQKPHKLINCIAKRVNGNKNSQEEFYILWVTYIIFCKIYIKLGSVMYVVTRMYVEVF
jgi:hypothetical protein